LFTCAAKRWSGEFFNAGLATGRGLVVVDVDDQRGEESLYELERKYGPLPETAMTRTGSGGRHHLLRTDATGPIESPIAFRPGIDIRADKAQIVLPPSVHPEGDRYRWIRHPAEVGVATLPDWLYKLLIAREGKRILMGRARGPLRGV
jgi:hypothetical protein